MRLRFNHRYKLPFVTVIVTFFTLIGCDYVDIGGAFTSQHTINERFSEKDSLPAQTFDQTVDPNNFSFLIMSDCHYYKENSHHISNAAKDSRFNDISFIYINGDNVQSGQQYQYDYMMEDIHSINIPVYAGIGNHDLYNDGYELFKNISGEQCLSCILAV